MAKFGLSFGAVGDWGAVKDSHAANLIHDSSTFNCEEGNELSNGCLDYYSQENVAYLMGEWANQTSETGPAANPPSFILGHGDSFYWTGIFSSDPKVDTQWTDTFENVYDNDALNVPWYNVMGNHDWSGDDKIPGDDTTTEAWMNKFLWQRDYVSPNLDKNGNPRWNIGAGSSNGHTDVYYKTTHTFSDDDGEVTLEVFHLDTNESPAHGGDEICCQLFGYAGKGCSDSGCKSLHDYGQGCPSAATLSTCRTLLSNLWDDSVAKFEADLKSSKADWKIVNTHYYPRLHFSDMQIAQYDAILDKYDVQVWMAGHTHGEAHEYDNGTGVHYILNGAGGGIGTANAGGAQDDDITFDWLGDDRGYAFVAADVSRSWLRVNFYTFDKKSWTSYGTGSQGSPGMSAAKVGNAGSAYSVHTWYIPAGGEIGCDEETWKSFDGKCSDTPTPAPRHDDDDDDDGGDAGGGISAGVSAGIACACAAAVVGGAVALRAKKMREQARGGASLNSALLSDTV